MSKENNHIEAGKMYSPRNDNPTTDNAYGIRRQMLSGLKFFWQYYYVVKFNKIKKNLYEQEVQCGDTADN